MAGRGGVEAGKLQAGRGVNKKAAGGDSETQRSAR